MKKFILLIGSIAILSSGTTIAKEKNTDIFKEHGFTKAPLTLSNGRYNEFFSNEEVVQIGTVLLNTKTNKIVAFLDEDTTVTSYQAENSSRWLSPDPLAEKYPSVSPYAYAMNNPILYIDPDGRDVVAASSASVQMVLNTLTKEDRSFVQFSEGGNIDKELINTSNSTSGNFKALLQLANDERTYEARVDNSFNYKNENGESVNQKFGEITQGDPADSGPFSPKTGEQGFFGVTQTPGNAPEKYNSPNDNVIITVNSGLSEEGRAENFAHEAYGHGFLFSLGLPHGHKVVKMQEQNEPLKNQIIERVNETEINYKSK